MHPLRKLWIAVAVGLLIPTSTSTAAPLRWTSHAGWREALVQPVAQAEDGFSLISPLTSGLLFTNQLPEPVWLTNTMLLNGSGVACGDVDGDGLCDLFTAALDGPQRLWRNLGGLRFEDVSRSAGMPSETLRVSGCAFSDIDGDRDLDLILNAFGQGTSIFLNDGKGRFQRSQLLNERTGPSSLALADVDGDGDLDLYLVNYRAWTFRDHPTSPVTVEHQGGRAVVTMFGTMPVAGHQELEGRFVVDDSGKLEETGEVDVLALNDGKGRFTPQPFTEGRFMDEQGYPLRVPPRDWGLSVMFRDLNGDNLPDIYVCNDFSSPDRIWINTGEGRFQAIAETAIRTTSRFAMGMDVADVNRDGFDDIFVADMLSPHHSKRHVQLGNVGALYHQPGSPERRLQHSRNTLLAGLGGGLFTDVACFSGVNASDWTWAAIFLDVDLDGFEDLLVGTGNELDSMNVDVTNEQQTRRSQRRMTALEILSMRKLYGRLELPKLAFRNLGGLLFTNSTTTWGFGGAGVASGMALADFDNDGDLDVVVNQLNGGLLLYRNNASAPRLAIRLKGEGNNTRGIGARISVRGGPVLQSQEVIEGGRYLSADDPVRVFAAGKATSLDVDVRWRSGKTSRLAGVAPGRWIEIEEPQGVAHPPPPKPTSQGALFEDASRLLDHRHRDEPFSDFERQALLPQQLSHLGPGLCWNDFDGDGWEDLAIGSGKGGMLAVYYNREGKRFEKDAHAMVTRVLGRDQTTLLGAGRTLFAGSANYEDGQPQGGALRIYNFEARVAGESVSGIAASTGPMCMADIDQDGDLDLFIGGRVRAERYPEPCDWMLLKNEQGRFVPAHRFEKAGLASACLFTDLDQDARPELVVACDWDAVRVFRLNGFTATEITQEWGISSMKGRWNSVEAGDFDGDGRMDLVAGNLGWNHSLHSFASDGVRLFYGSLTGGASLDLIEAYRDRELGQVMPSRVYSSVSAALPFVKEVASDYAAYSKLTVAGILGERMSLTRELHANHLASTVFLNRGRTFEARPLPLEAQLAPVYGLAAADFDGDGDEDLFVAQNLFAVNPDAWRMDGGRGAVLLGDGSGNFKAMKWEDSGISMHGEQRGAAAADFDLDGRMDVAVGQNSSGTKLYRNRGARQGLRVRLDGGGDGTGAVQARVRALHGGKPGPVREIRKGSGYWSQAGSTLIFAGEATVTELEVQSPGGLVRKYPVSPGVEEMTLKP
ncbi:MAG: hypothetical protein FJ405_04130 [Verrucomicrobia bacterium]|nr:hypothetical protein [Verrucomicrobiota bacterium]